MKSTRQPPPKKKTSFDEDFYTDFKKWWEPYTHDPKTGAEIGGHPEAYRLFVKPTGERKHYGIKVEEAFMTQMYRDEYHQWLKDGQPPRDPEPTGNCVPRKRVNEEMANAKAIMGGEYPF